ncbi:MAG: M1 family metallopeptidase [Clostridiales bacterium]|nr:M1 family metallopeptidase [Clostridiales bacterium]
MRHFKSTVAALLAFSMIFSLTACREKVSDKEFEKKLTRSVTTETIPEPTETEPPEPTETEPTDTEPTDSSSDPSNMQGLNLKAPVPEKNCAIEIPQDERYHYDMVLTLDPETNTVSGHVVAYFFNNSNEAWSDLCFRDYPSLFKDSQTSGVQGSDGALTEVTNITVGNTALTMKRDSDVSVFWVSLPQPLHPNDTMTLSYDFTTKIPSLKDRFGVHNGVYNVTNFYPILAVYTEDGWSHEKFYNMGECFFSEIADYNVMLTVPSEYKILSTGTETKADNQGDKTTYTISAPCVRDFVFCASTSFKFFEDDYKDTHIRVVYDEAHPASTEMDECAEASLKAAQDSLAAFGEAFGEYPYPELDIILAPIEAGGMEYPNLIICTAESYYCMKNSYERIPFEQMSIVVAHEIGHQWFMGIVGSNSGLEPWLDESFASYTEIVYAEYIGLSDQYDHYSKKYMDLSSSAIHDSLKSMDQIPVNRSYYSFSNENSYVYAAYEIGKQALYQMEEAVGREEFHAIIREYVHRNAFTNSTEDRFFEVLFECAGQDNQALNALVESVFER